MADMEKEKKVADEATEKKAKAPAKPAKKDKVPLGKRIAKGWREFKAEFKKIVWSGRKATFSNTVLVIVVMIVVAVVIGLLDAGFGNLLNWVAGLI